MTKNKRFTIEKKGGVFYIFDDGSLIPVSDGQPICDLLNELYEEAKDNEHYHSEVLRLYKAVSKENEQLKKENDKLHQRIFEMRTNIALERTEISKQTYTGKKNEKEYSDAKEFLDKIEKW